MIATACNPCATIHLSPPPQELAAMRHRIHAHLARTRPRSLCAKGTCAHAEGSL